MPKFAAVASMVYFPGGRAAIEKCPWASAVALFTAFVDSLLTVTVAF
jgi:hypothetical protein